MTDQETAREAMDAINPGALEYDEWLAVGMAAKDAGLSIGEFDAWCARDSARYKPKEIANKWNSFKGNTGKPVTVGSLVKMAADQGHRIDCKQHRPEGAALEWDAEIGGRDDMKVVRQEWLQDRPLPPPPGEEWTGLEDITTYIRTLFNSDERVGIVADCYEHTEPDGSIKQTPQRGVWDRTAGELLQAFGNAKEPQEVIGDYPADAGVWVRFNPLDGEGCSDNNVTDFRYALVESDDISVERQYAIYQELELPIAALVHSGGKSMHAIVRIDAGSFKEYQTRVDFLYDVAKKNGLVIDRKNRNPSRLSRLPGVMRGTQKQYLVGINMGRPGWEDWEEWISAVNDDLPAVENLSDYLGNLPDLATPIIDGLLRCGHKMLISGPSKAGKSFLLLQLAIAIAEGTSWLGWLCKKGRVLYVNLELDRASCYHRISELYDVMELDPVNAASIDCWHLRGKARPMNDLAPRLIRRAAKRKYSAIIIDPIYKVITGDENAAHEMAAFCNQFDRVCNELGAATIYCHHHSKGEQGGKRAHDRASGSGVFARDPDAIIDLIELTINEERRQKVVNAWECKGLMQEFQYADSLWDKYVTPETKASADALVKWAEEYGLGDTVRRVRPAIRKAAEIGTAWRMEGVLREFPAFTAKTFWFKYPCHEMDRDNLLEGAVAEGEEPIRKRRGETTAVDKEARMEKTMNAIDAVRVDGKVSLVDLTAYLGLSSRATRDRVKAVGMKTDNGMIVEAK